MKTYILASIFTNEEGLEIFKKNNEYQGVNWVSGAPDVKYRKYDNDEEFTSNADTRGKIFRRLFGSSYMRVVVGIMVIPQKDLIR